MGFRKDFLWGGATAANQCEGGANEGNRGVANVDLMPLGEDRYLVGTGKMKMYDFDDHYEITKNDKHTYFKEEGLYFDLYQLNTLKAKINKNQRECYLQFSNEVYNDAKERLTKKGDAYRLIEGVDHIQYITNDRLKTIYLKW